MNTVPKRQLSLLDSVCLIVGIIVGVGIYQVAPDVAKGTQGGVGLMIVWLLGGALSLCGALGYAELATAYPDEVGDYAYLTRAYGPWAGFLFGWMQLLIVRPGDIAVMAFAFATYAVTLPGSPESVSALPQIYACLAVAVLTGINVLGVRQGKWAQNALTVAKVLGLLVVIAAAFAAPGNTPSAPSTLASLPLSVALILVLFSFGGWNEIAYVAAEMINPRRNIVRALILGTTTVTVLYLAVNAAFLFSLGYAGLSASQAVAVDAVRNVFTAKAGVFISILICFSALGAVNGLILTGARISYATGRDHRVFRPIGHWHPDTGTPVRALLVQGAMAMVLIVVLGSFLNTLLYTAAPVYLFYLATNVGLIVLRYREPGRERPFKVWGYPFTTVVFCLTCGFLAYSAVVYKPWVAVSALGILMAGLPFYWFGRRPRTIQRSDSVPLRSR